MGNSAPRKLSATHADVEVYHVRDIWMHFSKAYSLGSGTFGVVFAANPKTSKISQAISAPSNADVKHSVPVPLSGIEPPYGNTSISMESSRNIIVSGTSSEIPSLDTTQSSGGLSLNTTSTLGVPKVNHRKQLSNSPDKRQGSKPLIRRVWSTENNDNGISKDDEKSPSPSPNTDDGHSRKPSWLSVDRYPSSEASSGDEDARNSVKTGSRRGGSLSPYRATLAARTERARSAIASGEAVPLEVAVKVITKAKDKPSRRIQKKEFANEVRILQQLLGSPGVVQFQGALVDKRHFVIVTEMCRGGELWTNLVNMPDHRFSEYEASRVIKEILRGLYYCHSKDIAHLDLKPENILLSEKDDLTSLKIVDFGCAKFTTDSKGAPVRYEEFHGSLDFAAPEVIGQFANVEGGLIKAVDMWSMGVLVFLMLTGSLPFGMGSDAAKRKKIYNADYQFPSSLKLSSAALDFVTKLLVKEPEDRMTVTEALEHPWVSDPANAASKESLDPMVLQGLKDFQNTSILRKIVASLLVRVLSEKEKEHIQRLFKKYDADGSGYLEVNEVVHVLREAFDLTEDEAKNEAVEFVEHFDANSDGVIGWEEFAELTLQGSLAYDKSRIRRAFRLIDENSDGVLSIDELKKALYIGTEQSMVTDEDFLSLIKQIDENNDGVISFEEFTRGLSTEDNNLMSTESLAPQFTRANSSEEPSPPQKEPSGLTAKIRNIRHMRHKSAGP